MEFLTEFRRRGFDAGRCFFSVERHGRACNHFNPFGIYCSAGSGASFAISASPGHSSGARGWETADNKLGTYMKASNGTRGREAFSAGSRG